MRIDKETIVRLQETDRIITMDHGDKISLIVFDDDLRFSLTFYPCHIPKVEELLSRLRAIDSGVPA